MPDLHNGLPRGRKRTRDLWENIERVSLEGRESSQPRKRGGKWVHSSHPLKQARGYSRPFPRASGAPPSPLGSRRYYDVVARGWGKGYLPRPPSPLAQATSGTQPAPTPRELTITMAAIIWSACLLFQEMPQASARPGPHLLFCIPRWITWSNVKKTLTYF